MRIFANDPINLQMASNACKCKCYCVSLSIGMHEPVEYAFIAIRELEKCINWCKFDTNTCYSHTTVYKKIKKKCLCEQIKGLKIGAIDYND